MRVWLCVALAAFAAPCLADSLLLISGEKLIVEQPVVQNVSCSRACKMYRSPGDGPPLTFA